MTNEQNEPTEGSSALLDGRHAEALHGLDLEAAVRGLGIDPAKVVVLHDWPTEEDLPGLAELRDSPFGPLLQAAAATAVSLGAAAQRHADDVRTEAAEEARRLHQEAVEEAERLHREAYLDARRIRLEARRRAAEQRLAAELHATVEAVPLRGVRALDLSRFARTSASRHGAKRRAYDPLLDPRVASQIRAARKGYLRETKRLRTAVAAIGALALVLGSAATMAATSTSPRDAGAALVAAGRDALDLGDAEQLKRVLPIEQVAARLDQSPERAGSVGVSLVGALKQVHELDAAERSNRALGLLTDIERAVRDGRLTPETERTVRPVLLEEATPPNVAGLIDVLRVRALGAGPGGPHVLEQLEAVGPSPNPQQRAQVMRTVRRLADQGRLTSAFRVVASAVLEGAPVTGAAR